MLQPFAAKRLERRGREQSRNILHPVRNAFDNFLRDLVFRGHLGVGFPSTDPEVDLGKHEILGLIDKIEDDAFVNLVGRNGLSHFGAVEVGTLDHGGDEEALRLFSK